MPSPTSFTASIPLRVRVHLNLANPELAENVVRVKAPSGAWITVAYATELLLENCIPVIDDQAQERIRKGASKKTPHAFIEGDLTHFRGRLRDKAPLSLVRQSLPALVENEASLNMSRPDSVPINYNPRFASCFYLDAIDKKNVNRKFEASQAMRVVGWRFLAHGLRHAPLLDVDRCDPESTKPSSIFELLAIRKGRQTTEALAASHRVKLPAP